MLGRLRRVGWRHRLQGDGSLEGVYTAAGKPLHYVLDDGEHTLCGRSSRGLGLHRWASQWSPTDPEDRCKRCDHLVGTRGNERHGPITPADVMLFGLEPPGFSARESAAFEAEHARNAARFRSVPPPEGVTFKDPPFELATDPHRIRGTLESSADRVVNEVYAQVRSGTRWHRIVALSQAQPDGLARLGRTYDAACAYGVMEFEMSLRGNDLARSILSTEQPRKDEMCQVCIKSMKRPRRR